MFVQKYRLKIEFDNLFQNTRCRLDVEAVLVVVLFGDDLPASTLIIEIGMYPEGVTVSLIICSQGVTRGRTVQHLDLVSMIRDWSET